MGNVGTSALKGASLGASAGTAIGGPVGTLAGAAIGAGIGAAAGAYKSKAQKDQQALYDQEMAALKSGNLGLTAAEKRQMVSERMGAVGSAINAQQTANARGAMGQASPGEAAEQNRQLAQFTSQAGAAAAADANTISRKQAEMRRREILARMDNTAAQDAAAQEDARNQMITATQMAGGTWTNIAPEMEKFMSGDYKSILGMSSSSLQDQRTAAMSTLGA